MPEIADPGSPEAGFELTQMAADVVAFMDGLGIGSAHIVGHSMGSVVAQELALARPERVRSLLLIGTYVSGSAAGVFEQFLTPVVEGQWKRALRARPGFDYPADAYLATPALADPDVRGWLAASWVADVTAPRAHLAAVLPETAATRLGTWIGALRAQKRFESSARLAALRVPVLVIWATQDNMFPAEPDQRLVREALDLAIDAGSLERYFYKIYGAQALPASGNPDSDIGHNAQWGTGEVMAADIIGWVTTGRPTATLPYADPEDATTVLQRAGAARIIERRRGAPPRLW